ncbi:MAG: calcium:proton antiporter [Rhodospirillales bacterium]
MAGAHSVAGHRGRWSGLLPELLPFLAVVGTLAVFQFGGDAWLKALEDPASAALFFVWLFGVMLWAAFSVVHHAEALAVAFGEPYGTLILTIAVTGIEASLIASIMLTGESAPTMARDTMFAVLMIVLNGLVGTALLLGGLRHREQDFNLQGARAFLSVLMPLAIFALVLPRFTVSTPDATFSRSQEMIIIVLTVLLYGVFLAIQTVRHRGFFQPPAVEDAGIAESKDPEPGQGSPRPLAYHFLLLILTLLPIVLLSKRLASIVDFGIVSAGAPIALGGVIIAGLVLAPESLSAIRAALANRLQRAINLLLGCAVATIGLTVPAVLAIGLIYGQTVTMGLDDASIVLLVLTLVVSLMTFGGPRTSLLQGAVHLVLFLVFLLLVFSP